MADLPHQAGEGSEPVVPGRPATIDPAAVWSEETGEWELGDKDGEGRPHGLFRTWRPDGTLASEGAYRAGLRQGIHRRFHPDGTVAREGAYADGLAQGEVVAWASDGPTTERLQSCCIPPGAWQRRVAYEQGQPIGDRWFDRGGVQILPSGRPYPPRPESVPPTAIYDEESEQWIEVRRGARGGDGRAIEVWVRWATDGALRSRTELAEGRRHGLSQAFDPSGALLEEITYRDEQRDGPYRRVAIPAGLYQSDRISEARGQYARDQAVGAWTLHDEDGELVRRFDLGPALDEGALRSWLAGLPVGVPAALEGELATCEREGRRAEALLVAACLSGERRDPDPLRTQLAASTPALTSSAAGQLAAAAVEAAAGALVPLANALLQGGAGAPLLRAIASALAGAERVALALLDGALALEPEHAELWSSRALVNVYLGRPAVARADVSRLPAEWRDQRSFLEDYIRIVFPRFDFWPARCEVRTGHTGLPEAPEQSLQAIRTLVQKYATRLGQLRSAIVTAAGGAADWLPPELGFLLPEGPVALGSWEFEETILDETTADGDAPAATLVRVDERLALDAQPTTQSSIPALMRQVRAEWNALAWLCWSAGLDRIALPEALEPPPLFGAALGMFVERVWRCRDKLTTSGLRALTQGIPGFVWEGIEIDLLPQVLTEIATDEHVEARALFYWLSDAGVQSPWQDNVRGD